MRATACTETSPDRGSSRLPHDGRADRRALGDVGWWLCHSRTFGLLTYPDVERPFSGLPDDAPVHLTAAGVAAMLTTSMAAPPGPVATLAQ